MHLLCYLAHLDKVSGTCIRAPYSQLRVKRRRVLGGLLHEHERAA
jgi:hypothetical protein